MCLETAVSGTAIQALYRSLHLARYSRTNDLAQRLENLDFARDINFQQFLCVLITTFVRVSSRAGQDVCDNQAATHLIKKQRVEMMPIPKGFCTQL